MSRPTPTPEQRRRFARVLFSAEAFIVQGTARHACALVDLSLRGALVSCAPAALRDDQPVQVELHLGDGAEHIALRGRIAHRDGDRLGIRCEAIDLDSITHLRRVVELNSGDAALLDRELAALVAAP